MVKPLADILAEIEERESIQLFGGGPADHSTTEAPADPGQDDTLGEEDDQVEMMDDYEGLLDAGVYGGVIVDGQFQHNHPESWGALQTALGDLDEGRQAHTDAITDANIEQIAYITRNDAYMDMLKDPINNPFTQKDKEAVVKDTLSSRGFLDPSAGTLIASILGVASGLPLGFGYKAAEDYAKNPARAALAQNLSQKGYNPTDIGKAFERAGIEGLDRDDIKDAIAGVGIGDTAKTQFSDLIPDPVSGGSESEDIYIPPPLKPTQVVATNMVEEAVADPSLGKGWSLDPDTWYTLAAQGGAIDAFSPGGLAGMMMPRQRRRLDPDTWYNTLAGMQNVSSPFGGQLPPRPPQFGGLGLQATPQPPQFPGFLGPFGPRRPPINTPLNPVQPPQRPKLDAETYFHTHEGGKVEYPNFPQPFINKEDSPNPFKGGGFKPPLPPARPAIPFQPYPPQAEVDEAIISQMNAVEQQPIPPVSISETTATAMQPEEVQETQTTTIEEAPVPREIDIQMPENITATLDFPEQVTGTANYARGGLAGLLKSLAPMGAGFLAGPLGYIPSMLAGAGTGYALAGKKRNFLDAIKGGLSGYAGSGIGRLGTAVAGAEGADMTNAKDIAEAMKRSGTGFEGVFDVAKAGISNPSTGADYFDQLGQQFSGVGKALTAFDSDAYKAMAQNLIGPATAGIAATAITPPSEMPEFTEVEVEQIKTMTPEQRRAYIENKRRQYSNQTMQPTTFARPNVGIDFDVTTAADGGVMEIDEEMESGSFVLPADVVSNVGDGSSTSGHRRLTNLFGMSEEEYAMGGGILKGPIKGPGGGLDDLIQTGIDGVRVARLSTDEFVVPKDVVRRLGDGSQKVGAEKLYDFMKDVRLKKHGTSTQPKEMHMSGLRKMV